MPFSFLAALIAVQDAHAHGIAGNRLFPGTITFDDPAVADELQIWTVNTRHKLDILPSFVVLDQAIYGSFSRLLTDTLAFGISSGGIFRSGGALSPRAGSNQTSLSLKHLVYKDALNETLVSASLSSGYRRLRLETVGRGRRTRSPLPSALGEALATCLRP